MPIIKQTDNGFATVSPEETAEISTAMGETFTDPSVGEVLRAGFRKENSAVSFANSLISTRNNFVPVPGYDPLGVNKDEIKGYEFFAKEFIKSNSPEETALIKQSIDKEFKDRRTLEDAGALGFTAQIAAGVTDPIYLALMATGIGAWGTAGKTVLQTGVRAAVVGGVSEVAAETVKHATQRTRTLEESMFNVGGATILSGLLGGGLAGLSKRKFNKMAQSIDDVIAEPQGKIALNGSIKDSENVFELVNAAKIEQFKVSPLVRTQTSPVEATQRITSEMMETPLVSKGNIDGIATAPEGGAVETRIKSYDAPLSESLTHLDDSYTKYRDGMGSIRRSFNDYVLRNRANKLSHKEFREEVGKALRRGDKSNIPEAAESADFFRKNVFDPLKNEAISAKLLPEDVAVETAQSYLTRIYKTKKIIAERGKWSRIVDQWLKRMRKSAINKGDDTTFAKMNDSDIADVVDQITDNILGNPAGRTPYEIVPLGRGPLKERTFNIPDKMIEEFLESDIDLVSRQYIRTMAPDVELTKSFGRADLADQLEEVTKDWNKRIRDAKNKKERNKLENRKEADIRDLEAMRDRLRGTYRMPEDPNSFFVRAGRTLRDINFMRMLGSMTISAIPDIARPIAVNGLKPVAKGLRALATSPKRFGLARTEAKKAAVGLDMVLNSRASSLAEVGDIYARGTAFERGLKKASDGFSKMTLMSQWNAALKQFSGVVTADRLLVESLNSAAGKISKNALRRMAQSGIGKDMAKRIAKQFQKYGDDGTIKLSNGHLWDDKGALDTFRSAVLKDVDRTIVTPGKGEAPLWTSSEMGKLIFQFKSFAGSAHHKIMLADLQHSDAAALNGFLLSVGLGSVTYGLKQFIAGRDVSSDPAKVIVESLDRSGGFGYFWDVNNVIEKASRGNIGVNKLMGAPPMSRYVSRNVVGALLGPSLGTAEDLIQLGGATVSGEFTKSDLRRLRQMMPGQNLFYMRMLLNNLEEEVGRGLK
jgi:hypothetical protein